MKAGSLLGVFLTARLLVLLGREVPLSPWTPLAFLWQDLLVALPFVAVDLWIRRAWPWVIYGLLVVYTALNVPLVRVISTPLTWPVLRAARGTLADSIAHHLTWTSLSLALPVLFAGALLPLLLRRATRRSLAVGTAVALPAILLGPIAAARVETGGLERNAVLVLLWSGFPRVSPRPLEGDWRESPYPAEPVQDLGRFRGKGSGRNVLLVLLESTGAGYLAPYGAKQDPTPHLSRLAREAILFENAYAVYPESIKGLFSTLSSLDPGMDLAPEVHGRVRSPTLASVLSAAGYRTALFHSGRFAYLGMDSIVRERGFDELLDAGDIGGNRRSSFGVDEPSAVASILSWIDGLAGAPFFAAYLPIAGHHPYEAPAGGPFSEQDEIGRYRNALHYGDAALGELIEGLKSRGLWERSLLVLAGDHGEAFHQHQGNYGHTFFIYEENVRVPYLIVLPGLLGEELRVGRVASLLDTAPTVLDLLGLGSPPAFQGRSLLEPRPRMALFFTDYSLALLGLRDGCWKLIHEVESGRSRLFDLCLDPGEREDLSSRLPERVQAYRQRLLGWAAARRQALADLALTRR